MSNQSLLARSISDFACQLLTSMREATMPNFIKIARLVIIVLRVVKFELLGMLLFGAKPHCHR